MISNIMIIFCKIRTWSKNFITFINKSLYYTVKCSGSANRHYNIFVADFNALFNWSFFSHCLAGFHISGIRHVAVAHVTCIKSNIFYCIYDFFRRIKIWVSKTEVIDIFFTEFFLKKDTFFKHFSYYAVSRTFNNWFYFLWYHNKSIISFLFIM